MSNEYKEWVADRSAEAWEDINKIAEIINNEHYDASTYYNLIKKVLEEGGWI